MTHPHSRTGPPPVDGAQVADAPSRPPGWAVGTMVFAAMAMAMAGFFQIVMGLAALLQNEVYVPGARYVFALDASVWGWIHVVVGAVVLAAGLTLRTARPWARAVGIGCAGVSALTNFLFVPYYPLWPILIIGLDVVVIWGLCRYDRDAAHTDAGHT